MNSTTTRRSTRRARRTAGLSVAAVVAGLALAPTSAHAAQATSEGGGGTAAPTGDKWSYMYDAAQRRDAKVRDAAVHADDASSSITGSGHVNAWSYMYDQQDTAVATSHLPLATTPDDSAHQRKQHTALANIVVGLREGGTAAESTCYLPDSLDAWSRRVIAVQMCDKAEVVPAVFVARVPFGKAPTYALGHL